MYKLEISFLLLINIWILVMFQCFISINPVKENKTRWLHFDINTTAMHTRQIKVPISEL